MNYTDSQGQKRDSNSPNNQRIKDKFVGIHVQANVSSMADYILSKGNLLGDESAPFTYEDCENIIKYENSNTHEILDSEEEVQKEIERLKKLLSKAELEMEAEYEIEGWEECNENYKEVLCWYIVDDFLLDRLKEEGEVVIEHESIWGRCTFGQSILLDSVIDNLCIRMEILEGQECEWKV